MDKAYKIVRAVQHEGCPKRYFSWNTAKVLEYKPGVVTQSDLGYLFVFKFFMEAKDFLSLYSKQRVGKISEIWQVECDLIGPGFQVASRDNMELFWRDYMNNSALMEIMYNDAPIGTYYAANVKLIGRV